MSRWLVLVAIASLASASIAGADPPSRWEKGRALYELGKYREAIVEWEAAYELDRKPAYLFALAQAYRFLDDFDRSIQLYRHYLDVQPNDPDRANIETTIEQLEASKAAKLVADKAIADKAEADRAAAAKAIADKAAADKAAVELAAQQAAAAGDDKHVRIAVDVGLSIIRIKGIDDDNNQSPQLGGRIAVSWIKRLGDFTLDLGGSWQLTTIPYTEDLADGTSRQASVFFTQFHATASIMRKVAGPVWARVGIGLGVSGFGNLKDGNPVTEEMDDGDDVRMPCARLDTLVGYRYSPTLDFVVSIGSTSISSAGKGLDPRIDRVLTFEGGWLGVYIKI